MTILIGRVGGYIGTTCMTFFCTSTATPSREDFVQEKVHAKWMSEQIKDDKGF